MNTVLSASSHVILARHLPFSFGGQKVLLLQRDCFLHRFLEIPVRINAAVLTDTGVELCFLNIARLEPWIARQGWVMPPAIRTEDFLSPAKRKAFLQGQIVFKESADSREQLKYARAITLYPPFILLEE